MKPVKPANAPWTAPWPKICILHCPAVRSLCIEIFRVPYNNYYCTLFLPEARCVCRHAAYYYSYYCTLFLPEARCVRRQAAIAWLPKSCPLLDLPDPSKTQLAVGTVQPICTAHRQPWQKKVRFLYTSVWQHLLCGYNLGLLCLDGGSRVQIQAQHPVRRIILKLAYLAIDAVIGIGWDCPDEVGWIYQLHVRSLGNSTRNKYKHLR